MVRKSSHIKAFKFAVKWNNGHNHRCQYRYTTVLQYVPEYNKYQYARHTNMKYVIVLLRPRSVSVSVLVIRDLRTSCPRTDPSTSRATPKLVTGGWSGFFAKSKFTSGPTSRDSITMSWPSLMISLPSISPGP